VSALSSRCTSPAAFFALAALTACGARSSLGLGRAGAGAGSGGSGGSGGGAAASGAGTSASGSGGSGPITFVGVASGGEHVCAVTSSGAVFCWGYGGRGQLGDGLGTGFSADPVKVTGISGAVAVAAGGEHTCAVAAGAVYCWGRDEYGQIGDGAAGVSVDRFTPVAVALPEKAVAVAAGGYHFGGGHTCALLASGAVWCWGADFGGQIGDGQAGFGALAALPFHVKIGAPATAIAVGGGHTCAILAGGGVSCWGLDDHGQAGNGWQGTDNVVLTPTPVVGLPGKASAIAAGDAQACAILEDGEAFCWGVGGFGQFGVGNGFDALKAAPAFPGGAIGAIDQGALHGCVARSTGAVECAGLDDLGEVGSGKPGPFEVHEAPVMVPIDDAVAVSTGTTTTCALRKGGALSCWGDWWGPKPAAIQPP
jgi:alpha-tubulin suppressor-like RCC1 family protein